MRPSLLGLGLLAPTASLGQVVVTVWVGTGDCSPTGGTDGSGAGGNDDRFGTETFAYTSTNSNGIVTTGIETSIYPITPASVAYGNTTVVVASTNSNSAVTTSTSPIIPTIGSPQPGSVTVETEDATTNSLRSTVVATNGVVTTLATTSTYPITSTTGTSQPGPVTVENETTTTKSLGSSTVATGTYVSVAVAATTPDLQTETSATCPQDNNTYYVAGGYTYEIYCSFDIYGSDLPGLQTDNLADCLLACSDYTAETGPHGAGGASCVAASWQSTGNNCSLKYGIFEVNNEDPGAASGRQVQFEPADPPTTNTAAELITGAGTANTGTPGGNNNGGLAISSMGTGSSPTTTPSPVRNGSPAIAKNSGAEPTYSNISPLCSDNNTYYVDTFGLRYDIRCGLSFDDADAALLAHADTFEGCIQYCSLLKDCAGVSFQDTNCYPIYTFRGYRPETAAEGTDLLTAVPTDGPNNGSITPDDLCAEGWDGLNYTDKFQCSWGILCDQTIGGIALQQTIQTNLEACITYCAFYDSCESVYFEGTGGSALNHSANCFPMSSIGAVSQDTGVSAASLQGTCNWLGNQ